jgi:peptidoglycan/xylan/chitin deacetylase (PgdA/CDA1 family)
MYHSVTAEGDDPFRITVRPHRFLAQMRWLQRRGWRGASVAEVLGARRDGSADPLVALTFDDGYADFVAEVMPVLAELGFTATVFLVAGALGGENAWDQPGPRKPLMDADAVRGAVRAGMEVGSHALTHRALPDLSGPQLRDEVLRSRAVLAEAAGVEVAGFCYPYGRVGAREVAVVQGCGYDYACAVAPGALTGRHALPRTYVGDRDGAPRLLLKQARHRLREGVQQVRGAAP